jgi:hypothetical protein
VKIFKEVLTNDSILSRIQRNISDAFSVVSRNPILDGTAVSATITSASSVKVAHKLQRLPQGFIVIDINTLATIKRISWDTEFIELQSSADCAVILWVF